MIGLHGKIRNLVFTEKMFRCADKLNLTANERDAGIRMKAILPCSLEELRDREEPVSSTQGLEDVAAAEQTSAAKQAR